MRDMHEVVEAVLSVIERRHVILVSSPPPFTTSTGTRSTPLIR